MQINPEILPELINTIEETLESNAEEVTLLDQTLGDGDHLINLQRGIAALNQQSSELVELEWAQAIKKIGMTLLSTMGGASGSLLGTFFISMSKNVIEDDGLSQKNFTAMFSSAVDAVKKRGKSDAGEKTLLDVLIPVASTLNLAIEKSLTWSEIIDEVSVSALHGMESTRNMLATKGRASYMGEKSIGHIDAGAKTSQLMICAIVNELKKQVT